MTGKISHYGVCHIVCGGPCAKLDIELGKEDMLIAADAGYAHCLAAGLQPELFVGDMDSLPPELGDRVACERVDLPRDKEDTDTLAACKVGLDRGYTHFILHAGLGGDVGHELANIQTLAFLDARGACGELRGKGQRVFLLTPEASQAPFSAPAGTRVSVFAFGGAAHGVSERGLRWGLDDATLRPDFPLGVSNLVEDGDFEVGVKRGMLLVVIG